MATVRPVRIEGSDSESDEYEPVDAAEGSRGERLLQELGDQDGAVKQELRPRPKKSNGELNPFCLGVNRNNVYRCGRRRQTVFCNHHATQWEALDDEYQHVLNEAIKLRPFDEAFWDRQHETVRNLWMQTVAGNNAQLDALTEQVAVKAEEQAVQYLTQAAEGAEKELEDAEAAMSETQTTHDWDTPLPKRRWRILKIVSRRRMSWKLYRAVHIIWLVVAAVAGLGRAARVAYIIPVHEPKFHFLRTFLASRTEHNLTESIDVHVVFGSQVELDKWQALASGDSSPRGVSTVLYGGPADLLQLHPIFFKKWWTVQLLIHRYDYFVVADAELEFVKFHDPVAVAQYIHNLKLVFGAKSGCTGDIIRHTMWRFSEAERSELLQKTSDGKLYLWYNELPVVEATSAAEYLQEFNVSTTPTAWADFDHLSYTYFMLLRHNWTAVDLTPITGEYCTSLGEEGGGNADALQRSRPHWASFRAFRDERSKFNDTEVVVTFHRDRARAN